jgi:hypothetical protein
MGLSGGIPWKATEAVEFGASQMNALSAVILMSVW